jgi:putative transposase
VWQKSDHWQVNRYVIMPDHIHFFCCPAKRETSFHAWNLYWRAQITRDWPYPDEKPIWQKDNWDTQIRNGSEFTEKWHYILNNPVRKGLVSHNDLWPYFGEIYPLTWIER